MRCLRPTIGRSFDTPFAVNEVYLPRIFAVTFARRRGRACAARYAAVWRACQLSGARCATGCAA